MRDLDYVNDDCEHSQPPVRTAVGSHEGFGLTTVPSISRWAKRLERPLAPMRDLDFKPHTFYVDTLLGLERPLAPMRDLDIWHVPVQIIEVGR